MLRPARDKAANRDALHRVKRWTRERFALPAEATVFVSEISCSLPGCPPLETVVAFWTAGETRHQFKIFKPIMCVIEDDLPPSWMRNALISDGSDADCC